MKTRHWLPILMAVLLVLSFAGQILVVAANEALDIEKECTLKVNPCDSKAQGNAEMADDLAKLDIVVDLYRVADWKVESTKYSFASIPSFGLDIPQDITKGGWNEIAQKAAGMVLLPEVTKPDYDNVSGEVDLPSGVYLLVAHKRDDSDYVNSITDEEGESTIVTQVKTDKYLYTFLPELVSLPSKTPEGTDINTANPSEWLYKLEVNLKPERSDLKGALEIVKTLKTYETSAPATFVFQIDWEENGQHRSDVRTLTFTAPGERVIRVEDLPVGAEVTVKEIYSGAVYVLETPSEQTATIKIDEIVQVGFTNNYDDESPPNGGGSITNRFIYGNDGWELEKRVDSTDEYSVIE